MNGENLLSLVADIILVQCNLYGNKYWLSNISLLNDEPSNLAFLKTYNTEFDDVLITLGKKIRRR